MRIKIVSLLVLLLFSQMSLAWWNDDWQFRKKITVEYQNPLAMQGSGDFPLLIRLHSGNFHFFKDIDPEGKDLRFISWDDKTPLEYHIEKLDYKNEIALIWLKMPVGQGAVSPSDSIYMYYGNESAKAVADSRSTYDVNEVAILHFAASRAEDATAFGNNPSTASISFSPLGIIGDAAQFKNGQSLHIAASPSLRFSDSDGFTLSMWLNLSAAQDARILQLDDGRTAIAVSINANTPQLSYRSAGNDERKTPSAVNLPAGEWHHLALSYQSGTLSLLVDGSSVANLSVTLGEWNPQLLFGSTEAAAGFEGMLDEIQLSNRLRTDAWLFNAALTQSMMATGISYGEDETGEGSSSGYFGIILSNVSVDGWMVIASLIIMLLMSAAVVVLKAIKLQRFSKQNKLFIDLYHHILDGAEAQSGTSTSPVSKELFSRREQFADSNLYKIYYSGSQAAVTKQRQRQGNDFSAEDMAVIKSSANTAMVREVQALNSQMVLLTIAISGGPFLGLLGTVMGVMITFAAIAASGDVNINAIAPGVSAALMTTVAGLAVAIPALFAYNYLSTMIKDITFDMRVFVDELVSRIAAHHSA